MTGYQTMLIGAGIAVLTSALATNAASAQASSTGERNRAGKQPIPHQMLSHRVNTYLSSSGSLAGSDIKVTALGDVVVLDGVVADAAAKELARALALQVSGVRDVEDKLRIDSSAVDRRRSVRTHDTDLSKTVASKLAQELSSKARLQQLGSLGWKVDVGEWQVQVTADAGDITLSGEAPALADLDDMLRVARSVPGVRSVRSQLSAATFPRPYGRHPDWGYHPYPVPQR